MSSEWIKTTLGEFIDFKNGKTSPDRKDNATIPVYGSNGVIGYAEAANAPENCLIIGRVGSYCGSVYHSYTQCWVTDNAILGLPKNKCESEFWYFLLVKLNLNNYRSGSGQPLLNQATLNSIPICVPKLAKERASIGKRLMMFDDKIEFNRQINQTLEQIAQAVFKSWFVDFEPVKAKIAAKQDGQNPERAAMHAICGKTGEELDQLSSEQRQQLAATAALFPDELVGSELGEIPKGWEVKNLGAITSELRRGISPKYIEEGGVRVINQKCIRNHTVDFTLCRRHDSAKLKIDERELHIGDVLVNSTGVGTLGRLAPVRYLSEVTVADSHVTVIRGTDGVVTPSFLAGLMLTKEVLIESSGAGSTGQTELRRQVLEEISFCKPPYKIQEVFEQIIEPTHGLIAQIELQQFALLAIREALLPKLLSGDLTVEPLQALV